MAYKKITKILPFQADDLFKIVLDVENYPNFLPHCGGVKVVSKTEDILLANMLIEYQTKIKTFRFAYLSKIEFSYDNFSIYISNVDQSLFKNLESIWKFTPTIAGCKVDYEISFQLKNPIIDFTVSNLLIIQAEKMMDAFIKQAQNIQKSA